MDMEKYTTSKAYFIFEWGFKLIIWNLMSLLIICLCACVPFIIFFSIQDNYAINNVNILSDSTLEVIQNNGDVTNIGNKNICDVINSVETKDNTIILVLEDYTVQINNENSLKNITSGYFNDGKLYITYKLDDNETKDYDLGNIYDSEIDLTLSKINSYQEVVIAYNNGTFVNYGRVLETKGTVSGILVFIGLILALFAFIPTFATIFSMIKIFAEDGSSDTFLLYFDRLWDNFKALYKLDIIIVIFSALLGYGLFSYYNTIHSMDNPNFFYTISYDIILICLILIILFILSIPMTVGYFRMKSLTILKFTISMTFKNILLAIGYVALLAMPILLCFVNNFFIPLWFLLGLSIPELFMYLISSKKYHRIVKDFNSYKDEDIYELEGDKENVIRD